MLLNCGVGEDSWESLGLTAKRSNQSILKEVSPEYSLEGLMLKLKLQYFGHLMRRTDSLEKTLMLWKIEGRRRRGQQRMRCWMASPTQWTWVWASSGSWWWTEKPGVLQSMGSHRVRHNWVTVLNWVGKIALHVPNKAKESYYWNWPKSHDFCPWKNIKTSKLVYLFHLLGVGLDMGNQFLSLRKVHSWVWVCLGFRRAISDQRTRGSPKQLILYMCFDIAGIWLILRGLWMFSPETYGFWIPWVLLHQTFSAFYH